MAGNAKYNIYGGPGWEQITDPDKVDFNILKIKGSDVYQTLRIKFVLVYNKSLTFTYELSSPITKAFNSRFAIVKKDEDDGTFLELLDAKGPEKPLDTDWYVLLEDGTYIKHNTEPTNKININEYSSYSKVFYQALITLEDKTKVPYDFTIKKNLEKGTVNVVFAGPDTFLYNSSGDITSTESRKEFVIKPSITTGEQTFIKSITWKNSADAVLYEMASTAKNSMLTNVWADTDHNVHFQLYKKFQTDRNQNTLKLIVETVNGETFQFNKTINFVKEGEQSVNGQTYNLIIDQYELRKKEENDQFAEIEIQPMIYKPATKSWNTIYIKPHLYENGEEIVHGQKVYDDGKNIGAYDISYQTQGIGVNVVARSDGYYEVTGLESPESYTSGQYFIRFVATVKLDDKEAIVNYYHPILIGYGDIDVSALKINNIPSKIVYNAAGGNPESNQEKIEVSYKNVSQTQLSKPESVNDNIRIVELSGNYMIYPAQTYKGAYFPLPTETNKKLTPMGGIKIYLSSTISQAYILQPVVMILSSQLNQTLEGYDGTVVSVLDDEDESLEKTKEIKSIVGAGKIPNTGAADPLYDGALFGQEVNNDNIYGVYLYNGTIPTTVLKSDGTGLLGDGVVKFHKNPSKTKASDSISRSMKSESGAFELLESNQQAQVIISDCMTITYDKDENGKATLSNILFSKKFKDCLKEILKEGS